eukprot:12409978-Ditylum_brightwellii.AAC.1
MTSLQVPKGRELSTTSNGHEDDNDFSNESAIDNAAAVGAVLPAAQRADSNTAEKGTHIHSKESTNANEEIFRFNKTPNCLASKGLSDVDSAAANTESVEASDVADVT